MGFERQMGTKPVSGEEAKSRPEDYCLFPFLQYSWNLEVSHMVYLLNERMNECDNEHYPLHDQ